MMMDCLKEFGFKRLHVHLHEGGRVKVYVVDRVLPDRTVGQWEPGWLVETGPSLRKEDSAAWFVGQDSGLVYDDNGQTVGLSPHVERIAVEELLRELAEQERWEDYMNQDPDRE